MNGRTETPILKGPTLAFLEGNPGQRQRRHAVPVHPL